MINIGIGIGWAKALYSVANNVIANFKARVLSYPNSIFETGPCLDATLEELNAIGLLDNASLVITPNAYTEGILYSVVPNTTLGDMDVVRATTATRVNSAGLIEVVPRNLLGYSEEFNNAYWVKQDITVTANATTAPNGTMTADSVVPTTVTTTHQISKSAVTSAQHTMSVYAKANGYDTIEILDFTNGVNGAIFNLTNGTLTNRGSGVGTITNVGNGWYRCTATAITTGIRFYIPNSLPNFTGNGTSGLFIWGAQLDLGATATEYFPTTTRLNIPRIDYTNGSCPSLLVEPQRTNVLTYSNDLNGVNWATINTTKTSGQVSPTPSNNEGWLLNKTATGVDGIIYNAFSIPSLSTYTYSWYILKDNNESRFPEFYLRLNSGQVEQYVQINTKTGNLGVRIAAAGCTQSISLSPNGLWWRLTLTNPTPIANSGDNRHGLRPAAGTTLGVYNINATGSVIVYGAQTEAGSYPTSYIPTVASSVTRNADVISKSGISSLIGQTEGTIFIHFKNNDIDVTTKIILKLWDGTDNNRIQLSSFAATLFFFVMTGGTTQINLSNSPPISINSKYKLAIKYANNSYKVFINGINVITNTSLSVPSTSALLFGNNGLGAFFNSINIDSTQLYKTALSDTECINLTTL
jgi:hypothetical protein